MIDVTARPEPGRLRVAACQQVTLAQQTLELACHGSAGIDQDDALGKHLRQKRLEEGIVGTAQDDGVATRAEQRFDVPL